MAIRGPTHRRSVFTRPRSHRLVGHSLGGNAIFDAAYELDQRNVPIELLVSFDATNPRPVPKNVLHVVNFFQQNGVGKQVTPGPDFKGELTNVDLTAETGLSHTTIDKSPRLHAMVMRKIADVIEKDLAKRIKASKKKPAKKKIPPANAAAPRTRALIGTLDAVEGYYLRRYAPPVEPLTTLNVELGPKRLELLHEVVPTTHSIALLVNPTRSVNAERLSTNTQAAAHTLGLQLHVLHASTERDLDTVFASLVQMRAGA